MSKKKSKKSVNNSLVIGLPIDNTDSNGFIRMKPTDTGKAELEKIRKRISKLTPDDYDAEDEEIKKELKDSEKEGKEKEFDPTPVSKMLDSMEEYVKAGKYGKAIAEADDALLDEYLEAFRRVDPDSPIGKKLYTIMRKLLMIGKSFYEYDDKQREVVDNVTYDGLMSSYLAAGYQEPVGIIPKGAKKLNKVAIRYPKLHNNMDKSYALRKDDPIPAGVKETDTVENFLTRVYKDLDLTTSTKIKIEVSPKIDGVSVNGTIHEDMLINPQSRGDEDESVSILGLNGLQVSSNFKSEKDFGIQYEIFVTDEDREAASEYLKLQKPYVSNRHAASGIIHRLSTMEDDGLLKFISAYPIASDELDGTYSERMDYISNFGIVPDDMIQRKVIKGDLEDLLDKIQEIFEEYGEQREELSYSIDGIVLTVVDDKYQEILGRNGRTNKFQIALKFDPASAEGIVDSISLDCGKKGYRTIQVNLEHPVFLDGVRYDHVPVLSLPLFEKLDLHKYAKVKIHRVGDVIPSITVIKKGPGSKLEPPKKCPVCGDYLDVRNSKLYCQNPECKANIVGRFTNFMEGLGLDGYNDSFSEVLVNTMDCKTLADIIELTVDDFKNAGVKGELAKKFPDALKQALNEKYDYEILACMGLPGIGPARAKLILQEETFAEMAGDKDHINLWPLRKYTTGNDQMLICRRNTGMDRDFHVISKYVKHNCKGMKDRLRIGHTGGDLSDEVKDLCKRHNFEIVDGKNFDILITTNMNSTSGKMELAKKKQLPIYYDEVFLSVYGLHDHDEDDDDEEDEDEDYTPPKKKNLINKIFKK